MKSKILKAFFCVVLLLGEVIYTRAMQMDYVSFAPTHGEFCISAHGKTATIWVDTADTAMTIYYNKVLAGGKWEKMMSDVHLGYTQWPMPEKDPFCRWYV